MSTRELWISWYSQVSVITIKLEVRYSNHVLVLIRSSSILARSDLALHSIIEGKGGLLPLLHRRCRTPPRRPLFLNRLVERITQSGKSTGGSLLA